MLRCVNLGDPYVPIATNMGWFFASVYRPFFVFYKGNRKENPYFSGGPKKRHTHIILYSVSLARFGVAPKAILWVQIVNNKPTDRGSKAAEEETGPFEEPVRCLTERRWMREYEKQMPGTRSTLAPLAFP